MQGLLRVRWWDPLLLGHGERLVVTQQAGCTGAE